MKDKNQDGQWAFCKFLFKTNSFKMNKVLYVQIVFLKVEWFKKRFEECDRNHDGKLQFDGILTLIFLNYEESLVL